MEHFLDKYLTGTEENLPYRHFMVCRPEVSDLELHPEEGQVPKLTEETFRNLFNEKGQLEDDLVLRKSIFFAGMERCLRKEVWPFLLHCYPYQSTIEERVQIAEIRRQVKSVQLDKDLEPYLITLQEYEEISRRRIELTGNQLNHFRRKVQSVVEKDVVRTDRGNPFFAGDDNPNLEIMKSILLNYAVYNPGLGFVHVVHIIAFQDVITFFRLDSLHIKTIVCSLYCRILSLINFLTIINSFFPDTLKE